MSKGSTPAGSTTSNPTAMAQMPFLQDYWSGLQTAYQNNPQSYYPGQTLADFVPTNPQLTQGYQNLAGTGSSLDDWLRPTANQAWGTLASGGAGYQNSPAYGGYQAYATGQTGPQQTYGQITSNALNSPYPAAIAQYAPQVAGYGAQAAAPNIGTNTLAAQTSYANPAVSQLLGPNVATNALAGQSSYNNPAVAQLLSQNPGTAALARQASYANPAERQLLGPNAGTTALAQAAQGQGMGLNALANTASGAYLNSNPYLDATYQAAADPVTRSYQTATAPTTDAAFSGGGRYGSGAAAGARDTNELNLGSALQNLSTNIYGQNYARERQAQDAAANNYQALINQAGGAYAQNATQAANAAGQLVNQAGGAYAQNATQAANAAGGLVNQAAGTYGQLSNQAAGTAGQLVNQAGTNYATAINQGLDTAIRGGTAAGGLEAAAGNQYLDSQKLALAGAGADAAAQQYGLTGLSNAFNAGNTALQNAAQNYPALAAAQLIGPNAQVAAGQGLNAVDQSYRTYQQAQIDDAMKRYNAVQATPWTNLNMYGAGLGQVPAGTNNTQPYFQNQLSDTLAGVTGGLGIGKQLLGSGGLLSGLGGAGSTASVLSGIGSGALPAVIAPDIGAAGLASLGAMNTGIPAIAAAAAPLGATIICSELVRQGRMPDRWRRAGMRTFAAYPEIARRGYYVWAIPSVRHLRRKPDSLYSRMLAKTFCWRAEDIAARVGVKGARKLWRGRIVTAAIVLPCLVCGAVAERDWREVYREEKA